MEPLSYVSEDEPKNPIAPSVKRPSTSQEISSNKAEENSLVTPEAFPSPHHIFGPGWTNSPELILAPLPIDETPSTLRDESESKHSMESSEGEDSPPVQLKVMRIYIIILAYGLIRPQPFKYEVKIAGKFRAF